MAAIEVWLNIDGHDAANALYSAKTKLDGADNELLLDCSSLERIEAGAVIALEKLADAAQEKGIKLVLRGVNVDVYKVLKLMRLAPRFAFVA